MTTQLVPFQFGSHEIRTILVDGQPLFCARDVALALDYANPAEAYKAHCKHLKKLSYSKLLELNWVNPNPQGEYIMPEPDVYRMIVKSSKPEAEKFEAWVFEEVLPTIRQTGRYTLTKKTTASDYRAAQTILNSTLKAARLLGADEPMARVIAVDHVRQQTGIDFLSLLSGNAVTEKPMTPTELGKQVEMTPRKMNALLALQGFQEKHPETGDWIPTDQGKPHCTCNPFKSPHSHHTGYRTLWYRSILDVLNIQATLKVAALAD